jgi:hypothetical protein
LQCPGGRESLPLQAGDGCARKRFRCDDAPIRRSGPPRHRARGAPGCRSPRARLVKLPVGAGAEAPVPRVGNQASPGIGSTPDGRSRGVPIGRPRAAVRVRCRSRGTSFALRLHPPKWAGVRARRNLTEQPTSRLCSADESVVTSRRCQRPVTRSFHGLCFPFKVPNLPLRPGDAVPEGVPSAVPKPGFRAPRPSPVAASRRGVESTGSLRGFTLPACRRSGGRDGRRGGAEAVSRSAPFQRRGGSPLPRPGPLLRPKPLSVTGAMPPEYVQNQRS